MAVPDGRARLPTPPFTARSNGSTEDDCPDCLPSLPTEATRRDLVRRSIMALPGGRAGLPTSLPLVEFDEQYFDRYIRILEHSAGEHVVFLTDDSGESMRHVWAELGVCIALVADGIIKTAEKVQLANDDFPYTEDGFDAPEADSEMRSSHL